MIGHTWSLGIEQQFYLLWAPLVALTLVRGGPRWVMIFAIGLGLGSWGLRVAGIIQGASFDRLYNGLDTRADGLMLGALGAVLSDRGIWDTKMGSQFLALGHRMAPLTLAGILAAAVFADWQSPAMYLYGFVIVEVLTLLVILDALYFRDGLLARFLRMRWLV